MDYSHCSRGQMLHSMTAGMKNDQPAREGVNKGDVLFVVICWVLCLVAVVWMLSQLGVIELPFLAAAVIPTMRSILFPNSNGTDIDHVLVLANRGSYAYPLKASDGTLIVVSGTSNQYQAVLDSLQEELGILVV